MTTTSSVWGRSERRGPFAASPQARLKRRVMNLRPWNFRGLDLGASRGENSAKATLYNFGPQGPTRRQREEMQRREEQARRLDRVRVLAQAVIVGAAALIMFFWVQWMR